MILSAEPFTRLSRAMPTSLPSPEQTQKSQGDAKEKRNLCLLRCGGNCIGFIPDVFSQWVQMYVCVREVGNKLRSKYE